MSDSELREFEALLYIADEALRRKTGNDDGIETSVSFETYTNPEGWFTSAK